MRHRPRDDDRLALLSAGRFDPGELADQPEPVRRCLGGAIWVPTAVLPSFGVTWAAVGEHRLVAREQAGEVVVDVELEIDDEGRLVRSSFDRWGDPDQTGTWSPQPFGLEVTRYATFDGVAIPHAGRAGWFLGTDRWPAGEFFRYEITGLHLVR